MTQEVRENIPDEAICPRCGETEDVSSSHCNHCDERLKQLETIVPRRVRAYKDSLPIDRTADGGALTPTAIYRNQQEDIQNTYAPVEDEAVSFEPREDRQFRIVTEEGDHVGTLEHGDLHLRSSTTQFFATYKGGGSDGLPTVFELCSRDNCSGVVARTDDAAYCLQNPEHDVGDSKAVRLATEFETAGLRVQMDSEELEHTLAHGFRAALQYIGGVSVRKVPETIEEEGTFVYDGDEGGSGISVLLTQGSDGNEDGNFQRAIEIVAETLDCDCEGGCPFCLYQYGCTNHNDPDNFDKQGLVALTEKGLQLEPIHGGTDE